MKKLIFMWWWGMTVLILCSTLTYSTTDSTLCDTGIEISQSVVIEQAGNVLIAYNSDTKAIYVIAFDFNRDGIYETLVFDTNGDGVADMQLEGGQATQKEVMWLYCGYQQLTMS